MNRYKRYPKYKDSGVEWIGEVPEHWEVKRMRYVASFTNSNVDKKSYDDQESVLLCNYIDVYHNEFITGNLQFMEATASEAEIERFSLQKWDVLMTKDSEDPGDIGVPSLVSEDLPRVVCGYHLTMIRADDSVLARLLHRSLMSHPTKAYFFIEAPGITRFSLGQDAIGNVPICLPPMEHRTAIADWIDHETARTDALIAKKTRFIELLNEKRAALITHAVTKGLDPEVKMKDSGVEWIGEIPERWTITKIKHVSRALIGLTYAPEDVVDDGTGITVLRSSNIQDGQLDLADIVQVRAVADPELMVRVGDILICSRNGSRALIGKNIQLDERSLGCTFGAFMTVVRGSFNDFLYYVFNSTMFDANSALYMTSTVNQLTISMIANMEVPLPPEVEQRAIVSHLRRGLSSLDVLLFKTQRSIDLLKERRSALITAAVTGKIDVRGWVPNALPQTHDLKGANT